MNVDNIKHITLGDIKDLSVVLRLSIKDARQPIKEFQKKKEVTYTEVKDLLYIAKTLGLRAK